VGALVAALGATGLTTATAAVSARNQLPPAQRLYRTLLATPIAHANLPAGFSRPRITVDRNLGPNPRYHHVVGGVSITLNSGAASIAYGVFPAEPDAHGAFRDALNNLNAAVLTGAVRTLQSPVPHQNRASLLATFPLKNGGVEALVEAQVGNVVVVAATTSHRSKVTSAQRAATIRLFAFALGHLKSVQRSLSG
jgi:hypothetical protein